MSERLRIVGRMGRGCVVAAMVAVALAGCGVKSTPDYPPGATHPQQYPEALPPLQVKPGAKKSGSSTSTTTSRQTPPGNTGGIYQYPNPSTYQPPPPPPNPLTTR